MISTLIYLSISVSLISTSLLHPVALTVSIITQTVLVATLACTQQESFWFGYILFLVFLGGMLILFSYVTSLASNFMFKFSDKLPFWFFPPLVIILLIPKDPTPISTTPTTETISQFYLQNFSLTLLMVSYLLMVLLIVVTLTNSPLGPLRNQLI